MIMRTLVCLITAVILPAPYLALSQPASQSNLRIVVLEGEDAVNVIQQKTAVAPLVEVRDRNGLPVSGAVVTFSIEGGKTASFAGGSTMTVTTNAAGRAAAATINPIGPGAYQIQVQASFQGQTAATTIAQTNVLTAAAAAGTAAAAAGTAGGAAGGGLSGTAIAGIAGGITAGAAAVAVSTRSGGENNDRAGGPDGTSGPVIDPAVQAASGTYTLRQVNGAGLPAVTVTSPPNFCPVITESATLTLTALSQRFEALENSRNNCREGNNMTFQSIANGTWTVSGNTLMLTTTSGGIIFNQPGTLDGSTLSVTFEPPHAQTGATAARVASVWTK